MATTLEKQINLKQVSCDTYTASWHIDWTVASSQLLLGMLFRLWLTWLDPHAKQLFMAVALPP